MTKKIKIKLSDSFTKSYTHVLNKCKLTFTVIYLAYPCIHPSSRLLIMYTTLSVKSYGETGAIPSWPHTTPWAGHQSIERLIIIQSTLFILITSITKLFSVFFKTLLEPKTQ